MRTADEFRRFYESELARDLEVMEAERKTRLRRLLVAGLVVVSAATVAVLLGGAGRFGLSRFVWLSGVWVIAGVLLFVAWLFLGPEDFRSDFKRKVVGGIAKFIDPGLEYNERGLVTLERFVASRLFDARIERFRAEDHVGGTLGKTALEFAEVRTEVDDGSGKRTRPLFHGLFLTADFNKDFHGVTRVLPNETWMKVANWALAAALRASGRPEERIRLESVEFDALFAVYSDDQVEARYILSPSLVEEIVAYRKKTGRRLRLSFVRSCVHLAIPYERDLFEPRFFRSVLDFGQALVFFVDLSLAASVVEDLHLNTRIWTKA